VNSLSTTQSYRHLIAVEAARILAEGLVQDYDVAKLKALKHLGLPDSPDLPTNAEVEVELKVHQAIFSSKQEQLIHSMRAQALEAMKMFGEYSPRLTGGVLEATATRYSPIEIQIFPDSPKDIVLKLLDLDVPFDTEDRRIRISKVEVQNVPVFCFGMGDFEIEVTALQPNALRQSPLSPINGIAMKRASIKKLTKMLAE